MFPRFLTPLEDESESFGAEFGIYPGMLPAEAYDLFLCRGADVPDHWPDLPLEELAGLLDGRVKH